jgi:hypothetical protein
MTNLTKLTNNISIESGTVSFLNAVLDPFKALDAARVPDLESSDSLCMRDYFDLFALQSMYTIGNISGVMIVLTYGQNDLVTSLGLDNDAAFYQTLILPIDATGGDIDATLPFGRNAFINQSTILGMQTDGTCDYSGLAETIRIFAGGIKVLPTIEQITDSSTPAILNMWGGQVTPGELANIIENATLSNDMSSNPHSGGYHVKSRPKIDDKESILEEKSEAFVSDDDDDDDSISTVKAVTSMETGGKARINKFDRYRSKFGGLGALNTGLSCYDLVRNLKDVQEYPNNQGCTVRFNPFQRTDQLDTIGVGEIYMVSSSGAAGIKRDNNVVTNGLQFPFICVRFNQDMIPDAELPLKIYGSLWMECQLIQPSPIYSNRSPVDPNYPKIRAMMSDTVQWPLTVSGHTFHNFMDQAPKFAKLLADTWKELRPIGKDLGRILQRRKPKQARRRRKARPKAPKLSGNAKGPNFSNSRTPNVSVGKKGRYRKKR